MTIDSPPSPSTKTSIPSTCSAGVMRSGGPWLAQERSRFGEELIGLDLAGEQRLLLAVSKQQLDRWADRVDADRKHVDRTGLLRPRALEHAPKLAHHVRVVLRDIASHDHEVIDRHEAMPGVPRLR